MRWIPLDEVTDAMRLAEDLTDDEGRVLVAAGQCIPEHRRESLRRRGVGTVAVEDAPNPDANAAGTASSSGRGYAVEPEDPHQRMVAERLERLRTMFIEHRDDPLMLDVYRLACRVARDAVRGGNGP